MYKICYVAVIALLILSCRNGQDKQGFDAVPDSVMNQGLEVSDQAMGEIIENIASPVEIAALLKKVGAPFSQKYLANPDNTDQFSQATQQAFNLGIFGANLGYLNMYNKTSSTLNYLSAIKELSDDIKVGQFFDFATLKRLAQNNQNLDSLMYISVHSFNMMDDYLRENKRSNLSALIIAGVWVEGLHLATSVYSERPSPELAERIGEQKIILADLYLVLKNYSSDPYFQKLLEEIDKLKLLFNEVKITYEMGEPEMVEENGMLTIKQNEKSVVHISPEQIAKIVSTTAEVRNNLIKL